MLLLCTLEVECLTEVNSKWQGYVLVIPTQVLKVSIFGNTFTGRKAAA